MGSNSDNSAPSSGLTSALAIFPAQSRQIEDLFESDEGFRGICEDLADAQTALRQIARLPDEIRDSRRLEYKELVEGLAAEIEEALSRAKIIHLRQDKGRPTR
ncbi:hypothetical protein [Rhizobium sp. Root1220]|uniref:hypothetical protein n=1 Tax=Rhizobium sp. Root1220 TaxID=1736432 RepID=UPI0006F78BD3|nr:hypothetical protein [Rhizobium sp. Root1220]KQV83345.1 hypothetical protein ASC90_20495 [Rhizobium sp. Root1220]